MFLSRRLQADPGFAQGVRDMLPQAPGIAAWGLMTGVAMVQSGMSVLEAVLMTLLVFAGSAQLAAIPLIVAGAPAWVILATAACVNLRFVVFSLHLRAYLMHLPAWQRLTHGYLTADLSYVLFVRRHPAPATDAAGHLAQEAYLAGNCAVNWSSWIGASLAGVALANFIPTRWGLGFAGILCLVGLLCSLATTRMRALACALAGATAVVSWQLPLKLNIVVAIAVAVALCLAIERPEPAAPREAQS
jgi:predicted branched-subunit amino acid permease